MCMAKVLIEVGRTNRRVAAAARALTSWLRLFEHTLNQRSKVGRRSAAANTMAAGLGREGQALAADGRPGDDAASRGPALQLDTHAPCSAIAPWV